MAQTGKLGIADSLLANVQLAFAAADAPLPSITTESGRLGGQLGDTILALSGVAGPLTFHLSAESTLVLAQTADPAPTFAAYPSPHWTLGGHDSKLGATGLAFTGAVEPLPPLANQTGRLGTALGSTVLGFDGVTGPRIFCMAAESVLALAQVADPAPVFAPHASRHWVLGGHDAVLGSMELAFAGAADPRPLTGNLTGKLGTVDSILGGVRLALGEQEGESTAASVYADASNALSLTTEAGVAVVRSALASSNLSLTDEAGRNNLLDASAESTLSLDGAVANTIARAVAAESEIALLDSAGRNNLLTAGAESTISPDVAAGVAAVRPVAAESVLELIDAAASTGRTIYEVAGQSTLDLATAADFTVARVASASSAIDLTSAAGRNNLPNLNAESTISLTGTAGRNNLLSAGAASTISLTGTAGRNNLLVASAESTISLQTTAVQVGRLLEATATSALELANEAACIRVVGHHGESWDFIELYDWATVAVVRGVSAQNTIELSQSEHTARPWYLSAETPIQSATLEYDPETDKIVTRLEGLQDSASVARPLTAAVQQSIPLAQSASVVRVKPNAINLSAESALELLGEIHTNQTGQARDWLSLRQAATVDKCKLVKSALDLSHEAAVLMSVPRSAASALGLQQAATYSIVSRGVLQQYHPFVGEGASGSPTPPAVTIGPPEHVSLPFQLFYPAEGVVTDSVTLRAPNLGNKDRLSFNRILRETRGGTLIVFADPIWPKIQTLVLTFSGLRSIQAQQLLAFLDRHLGDEVGLLDWEGRAWKGIIATPTDPVVQDSRDSFSASLEFEGELVPA